MVRRHQPMHLRAEHARPAHGREGISRPAPEPSRGSRSRDRTRQNRGQGVAFSPSSSRKLPPPAPTAFPPGRHPADVLDGLSYALPAVGRDLNAWPPGHHCSCRSHACLTTNWLLPTRSEARSAEDPPATAAGTTTLTGFTRVDHPAAHVSAYVSPVITIFLAILATLSTVMITF